jgi:hypothetical protein
VCTVSPKRKVSGRDNHAQQRLWAAEQQRRRIDEQRHQFLTRTRRRWLAKASFFVAVVVLISHWAEHIGFLHVLSPAAQDIFIGYPTAFLFLVIGGVLWGV